MTRDLPLVTGFVRIGAVALAVMACTILVHNRLSVGRMLADAAAAAVAAEAELLAAVEPATEAVVQQATEAEPVVDAKTWLVSAEGWQLHIDRATLDFATVAESFADRPRTVAHVVELSPYDPLIKFYAAKKGFDWRFIAAVIDAESGFNPRALSPKGAYGLMQVRDIAARAVGETSFRTPADNIRTGVNYLRKIEKYVPGTRGRDRLQLLLAAYNVGPGHLEDARRLAREHGLDPNRWYGGIREVLPALENPRIYPYLRHGFARGSHVVSYVDGVWQRYLEYQRATAGGDFAGPDPRSSGAWLVTDSDTARG